VKAEVLQFSSWALAGEERLATRSSLLCRLQDINDDASWHTFFEAYWRLIYNMARKSGLADADAQDVVQETIIAVARKMPQFRYDRSKGSFKQWLLLITRRRIHDHLRRVYRSPQLAEPLAEDGVTPGAELPAPELAPDAQIEAAWEYEWRQNLLQGALGRVRQRVNPKHYQVFDCCVMRNVPVAEVGRMFGIGAAQVYLINHRVGLAVKRAAAELEAEMEQSRAR